MTPSDATRSWMSGGATSSGASLGELARLPGRDPRGRGLARRHRGASWRRAAASLGIEERVYLCDTWKGVVKTGEIDTYYRDGKHDDASRSERRGASRATSAFATLSCWRGSFRTRPATGSPSNTFRLCHCDVDVYQSAQDVLDWVWPRLVAGRAVVFDDYGFPACPGVTKLVDEQRMRRRPARPP